MGWKFSFRAWCWSQARLGVDFKVLIVISFFVLIPSNPRCWLIPRFYLFVFIAWCWFQANPMGLFLGSIIFFFLFILSKHMFSLRPHCPASKNYAKENSGEHIVLAYLFKKKNIFLIPLTTYLSHLSLSATFSSSFINFFSIAL